MLLVSDKEKFSVQTIEKCGCTILRWWFYYNEIGMHLEIKDIKLEPKGINIHSELSGADKSPEDYKKFIFVRNPYSRLVSAYFDKIDNPFNKIYYHQNNIRSLRDFVYYLSEEDLTSCDPHWRKQSSFLKDSDYDLVGKVESFQNDFNTMCNLLGKENIKLHNWKEKKRRYKKPYYSYLTKEMISIINEIYFDDFVNFNYGIIRSK